jgi:hypothetical protein
MVHRILMNMLHRRWKDMFMRAKQSCMQLLRKYYTNLFYTCHSFGQFSYLSINLFMYVNKNVDATDVDEKD